MGTDIVRYDIYGKDVYIANKMESNGLPGRVMISERTENIVSAKFNKEFIFEQNQEIDLPIFGEKMQSYFVYPQMQSILFIPNKPEKDINLCLN